MAKTQDELDMLLFRAERALAAAERKTPPDADEVRRLRRSSRLQAAREAGARRPQRSGCGGEPSPLRGAIIMAASTLRFSVDICVHRK